MVLLFFLLSITTIGILFSIHNLIRPLERKHTVISLENVIFLFFLYVTILIGFGLIYSVLEMNDYNILVEGGIPLQGSFFAKLEASMYFSAVTLLSVGYGDITPVDMGRWIAMIEALLGYTMPAAFIVRTVMEAEELGK